MTEKACPFCAPEATRLFHVGSLTLGLWDGFPVGPGHALLIPKRHIASWFEASSEERAELFDSIEIARAVIEREHDPKPDGFNIGINVGAAAGQTVGHLHVHVIPRYVGDTPDPRGGVRHVIPERGNYLSDSADSEHLILDREDRSAVDGGASPKVSTVSAWSNNVELGTPHSRALIAGGNDPFLPHLRAHMDVAERVDIAVAFVLESGLNQIEEHLADLVRRGGQLRFLTGDYLGVTDPRALRRLLDLQNEFSDHAEVRVLEVPARSSFHPKAYIFEMRPGAGVAIVGSSNLTATGLGEGIEWSYRTVTSRDEASFRDVADGFELLYSNEATAPLSHEWIDYYESRRDVLRSLPAREIAPVDEPPPEIPGPHEIQRAALLALKATRVEGYQAGLVVMATGLGKTWLAAFDSDRPEFERILFVAHREEILRQSLATFRKIRPKARLGYYTGAQRTPDSEIVFASIQTLGKQGHLNRFPREHFDYIVVDEFHHAAARTYKQLIQHFEPKFLLGLTATPERLDGGDILALCQDNLVYRCDAPRGIDCKLLSPFNYFGIGDEVDYSNIPWRGRRFDEEALTREVATQTRAGNVFEQWSEKGGERTLAFCCSVRHADFMRDFFGKKGVPVASVHSGETSDPRAGSLERLETGELKVLFAVDIFNEGVDLPLIDTVLMLRPTESAVIWMQQFGRGLRFVKDKTLVVLDYIGNHRVFLVKIQTLLSLQPGDGNVRQALLQYKDETLDLPDNCNVKYDLQAIEILQSLSAQGAGAAEMIELWYRDFRERRDERPTVGQMLREGYNPRALRTQYGSWLGFVDAMGDLSEVERELFRSAGSGDFLRELETTRMTKSYKMLVLRAMLDQGLISEGISIEAMTNAIRGLASTSPRVRADLGEAAEDSDSLRRLLKDNPIRAWVGGAGTGGQAFFDFEDGFFRPSEALRADESEALASLVSEIVDWRYAEYFQRDSAPAFDENEAREDDRFLCHLSHSNGRPIIFLPSRERLLKIPTGWTPIVANNQEYRANFVQIAVNVVQRAGQNDNVLPEILRGWFGENAGLPGTLHEVEFAAGADGKWNLAPKETSKEHPGLAVGRSYMRAEIPPNFGLEFHKQKWEQGFVKEGGQIFLLVTMEKKGMPAGAQYEDRFLGSDRFEWKSQNRHTQAGRAGQAMRHHKEREVPVHLLVRKKSKFGSKAAPFVYVGEVEFESWEDERPITVVWRLNEQLSAPLQEMFEA